MKLSELGQAAIDAVVDELVEGEQALVITATIVGKKGKRIVTKATMPHVYTGVSPEQAQLLINGAGEGMIAASREIAKQK